MLSDLRVTSSCGIASMWILCSRVSPGRRSRHWPLFNCYAPRRALRSMPDWSRSLSSIRLSNRARNSWVGSRADVRASQSSPRIKDQRVIPYWDRAEIEGSQRPLAGHELFWVADPVELFFLHIQGSGRILFEDGTRSMVNYAGQNGHPYHSISKWLIDRYLIVFQRKSNSKTYGQPFYQIFRTAFTMEIPKAHNWSFLTLV